MTDEQIQAYVSQHVKQLRSQYIKQGRASSYYDINDGICDQFADEMEKTLSSIAAFASILTVEGANFTIEGEGEIFDQALLAKYWAITPPVGWTWKELEAVGFGQHVWIIVNGRHYDAECPDGVASFFDLPLFRRYMVYDLRSRGISCADVSVEDVTMLLQCPIPNPVSAQSVRAQPS